MDKPSQYTPHAHVGFFPKNVNANINLLHITNSFLNLGGIQFYFPCTAEFTDLDVFILFYKIKKQNIIKLY